MATPLDDLVTALFVRAAELMRQTRLPGHHLRERNHLDPLLKAACDERLGERPVSRTLKINQFVGLGPVDVVVSEPRLMMELKWSYEAPGKTFEALWDAIKLAMLGAEYDYENLYLAVGASEHEWERGEVKELFENGRFDPLDLWNRTLIPKRSPNRGGTIGGDLVIGARGNQPTEGPAELRIRRVARILVVDGFELRVVAVAPEARRRAWPQVR